MGLRPRQDIEGKGEEPVAGEDRGGVVEGLVDSGLAAAQVVIVHGRQVVMHQRIAMHAFERGPRHQRLLTIDAEQACALHHQEGPEPLAGPEAGIAHGVEQPRRAAELVAREARSEQPVEQGLGVLARPD